MLPFRDLRLLFVNRATLALTLAFAPLFVSSLSGCSTVPNKSYQSLSSYTEALRAWEQESDHWMAQFAAMAPLFPRPLPQLAPESRFQRHIAALGRFRVAIDDPSSTEGILSEQHALLASSHENLRDAYNNMQELAERRRQQPDDRPRPEFAEDEPH